MSTICFIDGVESTLLNLHDHGNVSQMRVLLNTVSVQLTTQGLTVLCYHHVEITVKIMRHVYKQIHTLNVKVVYIPEYSHIDIYYVLVSSTFITASNQL